MAEYNSSTSKGFIEYTKKEALNRYYSIWNQLYNTLSTEESITLIKNKLSSKKGGEIVLDTCSEVIEDVDKGNDSFIGLCDLNMDSLLTIPSSDVEIKGPVEITENTSRGRVKITENKNPTENKNRKRRISKLVVDESDLEEVSSDPDGSDDGSEYAVSGDELSDDFSEISSKYKESEDILYKLEDSVSKEEEPEGVLGVDFNPNGIKRVKLHKKFNQ
ncbi:hypothetical protein NEPAR04_2272 [Nematocida parisii]|nr:hypothetical protein NEPAR04_2272 [Nematocida parisii]